MNDVPRHHRVETMSFEPKPSSKRASVTSSSFISVPFVVNSSLITFHRIAIGPNRQVRTYTGLGIDLIPGRLEG